MRDDVRRWTQRNSFSSDQWSAQELVPAEHLAAAPPALPEVSERDLVAHVSRLSVRNYSVDHGAYPLGSCTMKHNPKLCDTVAAMPGLALCHPAQPADQILIRRFE